MPCRSRAKRSSFDKSTRAWFSVTVYAGESSEYREGEFYEGADYDPAVEEWDESLFTTDSDGVDYIEKED